MNLRTIIFSTFLLCMGLYSPAFSQQTAIYKDAQATYKRGMEFYEMRLYGKAQEEFEKVTAMSEDPFSTHSPTYVQKATLYSALAALYLGHPDAEKRLKYAIASWEPHPYASMAKRELGSFYYNKRNYDKAIEYLKEIKPGEVTDEELVEMKFKLGYCYFVKKKLNKAKPLFKQIRNTKSEYYFPSNYYYGIITFLDGDNEQALQSFRRVEKSSQFSAVVPLYICQILFAQKEYQEVVDYGKPLLNDNRVRQRPQINNLIGQAYFEQGKYAEALPFIQTYVAKSSKVSKETLYQLAYTQYKSGRYAEAAGNFVQLNSLKSELGQNALYNLADCDLKLGKKLEARNGFLKASQMEFNKQLQEDALINYAKLSYELGFDTEAINALRAIPDNSSYHGEAQNLLSKVFLNTRDYAKALETLRTIKNKKPLLKETHQKVAYFRAIQLFSDKDYEGAIEHFEESLSINVHKQTTALSHFWKAEAHFRQEQFDDAIKEYKEFANAESKAGKIPDNSSSATANYGLGYSYIKKAAKGNESANYKNASEYFEESVEDIQNGLKNKTIKDEYVTKTVYPDALLRAGDCYLFRRKLKKARKFYDVIINRNYPFKDYALYQQSLIHSLDDRPQAQIRTLEDLIADYPTSLYADDAYFALGSAHLKGMNYNLAEEAYQELLNKYPNSDMKNQALMKLGILSLAQDRKSEALDYYKRAFANDPQGESAEDALAGIEDIYVAMGNPEGYFEFMATVPGYKVDDAQRDSVMFRSAFRQYQEENYEGAISGFNSYLERFPSGLNNIKAHFYRGESAFKLQKFDEAIQDYAFISEDGKSSFIEKANYRAAIIAYHSQQNFAEAFKYFDRLRPLVSSDEMRFEALQYGTRSAHFSENYDAVPVLAEEFLKEPQITDSDKAETYYYLGKAHLHNKSYNSAKDAFQKNIELSGEDGRSAEARYQISYIYYVERDLDIAQERCLRASKEMPNQTYWLVKSFVLLADIYTEQNKLFNAKTTLESVISNYGAMQGHDETLLQEAKDKLANVEKLEAQGSKLRTGDNNGEFRMIDND